MICYNPFIYGSICGDSFLTFYQDVYLFMEGLVGCLLIHEKCCRCSCVGGMILLFCRFGHVADNLLLNVKIKHVNENEI